MTTPATTGPTRERITRKKWEEHPTPDDAAVYHLFPGYEHEGTPPPGTKAHCGYVLPTRSLDGLFMDDEDPRACIVCNDLFAGAER